MFALRVAIRYLFSKKTHNAVNIISLVAVVGVAVATMAIVCVLSVFNGFSDLAARQMSRLDPEIKVTATTGKTIANGDSIAGVIASLPEVAAAVPTIQEQALAMFNNRQIPITLKGIPDNFNEINSIDSLIIDGAYLLPVEEIDYATLSVGTSMSLKAYPGDFRCLKIYVPKRVGRINTSNPMTAFRADSLLVGGVFRVEQQEYDTDMVIVPLENARRLLQYTTESTAIEIATPPGVSVDKAIAAITAKIGSGYEIKDRMAQQEQAFRMISIEKWISFVMLAFILIIASFNIISTLSMLVIEKDEIIHTFKALGASQGMIARIFMLEGWLISLAGGFIGVIIGVTLCLIQQFFGVIKLNADPSQLTIATYPVVVNVGDLVIVMALVAVVGLLTSLVTSVFTRRRLKS